MKFSISSIVAIIRNLHVFNRGVSGVDCLEFGRLPMGDVVTKVSDRTRCEFDGLFRGLITGYLNQPNRFKRSGVCGRSTVLPT